MIDTMKFSNEVQSKIDRIREIETERKRLNSKLREEILPIFRKLGEEGRQEEFNELLSEIPNCPVELSIIRMEQMYIKADKFKA